MITANYTEIATGATHPNSYWVADSINLNLATRSGVVTVKGYHDKPSQVAGKQPILTTSFNLTFTPAPTDTNAQNVANIYTDLLTMPFFVQLGATLSS